MDKKHVILANDSRLLREMFQRVIDKSDHLEVVQQIVHPEDLPLAIECFNPAWVILSPPFIQNARHWLETCTPQQHPSVGFILLSPGSSLTMKQQTSYKDLTNISLKDFIHILEMDLQPIGQSEEII